MKSEEHHKNMNLLMDKVVVKQKDFQKDPQRQLLNQSSDRQMYSVKIIWGGGRNKKPSITIYLLSKGSLGLG